VGFACSSELDFGSLTGTASGAGAGGGEDTGEDGAGWLAGSEAGAGVEAGGGGARAGLGSAAAGEATSERESPRSASTGECTRRRAWKVVVRRPPRERAGESTLPLCTNAIASSTLPALDESPGIGLLNTPGKPSWAMKKTKPSPTTVTRPSKAIEALRNLTSIPSPIRLMP
jgi:hypothetical protein